MECDVRFDDRSRDGIATTRRINSLLTLYGLQPIYSRTVEFFYDRRLRSDPRSDETLNKSNTYTRTHPVAWILLSTAVAKERIQMRTQVLRAGLAIALSLGLVSQANAIPMLRLTTSAGGSVTVTDGGAGDLAGGTDGVVVYSGSLGGWIWNIASGFSKPALGTADSPVLDLNSVNLSSSGYAGTVNIWLTDTDFTATPGLTNMIAAIGGTTFGSVSYRTFVDSSNTAFGTATELTNTGGFTDFAFASTINETFSSLTAYSLTLLVSVTHESHWLPQISSFDAVVSVPEPSSLFLLGAGLLAVGFAVRRRSSKSAR
jgi:hypothetical protein